MAEATARDLALKDRLQSDITDALASVELRRGEMVKAIRAHQSEDTLLELIEAPDGAAAITKLAGQLRQAGFNVLREAGYADAFESEEQS